MRKNKENIDVQSVRCPHCNATFMGTVVPYCYESKTIQKEVAKYSKLGCKIEIVKVEDFKLEFCDCDFTKPKDKNQKSMFD